MNKKLDRAYYDILEIKKDISEADIKKAFKKAALKAHPDKGGTDELFQMVNEAWSVLGDPAQRAEYDRDLKKYGLKDGMGGKTGDAKKFQKQFSQNEKDKVDQKQAEHMKNRMESQQEERKGGPSASVSDVPDDIDGMTVKEIKAMLDKLGVNRNDCFEKEDLVNRLKEVKKSGNTKPPPSSSGGGRQKATRNERARETPQADDDFDLSRFEMPKPSNLYFKIISVGNQEAGKSCLIKRYCEGRFVKRYISTIGIDYGVKKLDVMGYKVCINFFDLSGNDEYKMIRTDFYKDASGVIMVYDVDNRDSYISLVHWEEEMKRYGIDMTRVKVILCGNKCDSKSREVKEVEAKRWAQQRGWEYFETSASEGKNVTEAFENLFTSCTSQYIADKAKFKL